MHLGEDLKQNKNSPSLVKKPPVGFSLLDSRLYHIHSSPWKYAMFQKKAEFTLTTPHYPYLARSS